MNRNEVVLRIGRKSQAAELMNNCRAQKHSDVVRLHPALPSLVGTHLVAIDNNAPGHFETVFRYQLNGTDQIL